MNTVCDIKGGIMTYGRAKAAMANVLRSTLLVLSLLLGLAVQSQALTVESQQDIGNITVMEVSGSFNYYNPDWTFNQTAREDAAKAFLQTHRDEYDFLVFFTNFDIAMPSGVAAFYAGIRNDIQGLGRPIEDYSSQYGSNSVLQGTIDMGDVANHSLDPLDPDFQKTIFTLTHEQMHRWGAYVDFIDPDTQSLSTALRGIDGSHWSYLFDSDSSTLYGNHWQDNGDGSFTSIPPTTNLGDRGLLFSPLELYLMGIIDKSEVPPMLLIDNPAIDSAQYPELDATITGTAKTVTIDDIVAAMGDRVPAAADAPKSFRTAFVYLTAPGAMDMQHIYGLEDLRAEWLKRFSILTDGKAIMEVTSDLPIDEGLPSNPGVTDPTLDQHLTPNAADGVAWLQGQQSGVDYSWADNPETIVRDTASAISAMKPFTSASQNVADGQSWLSGISPDNLDYLARQVGGLADPSAAIADLLSRQNIDGGWGSDVGYLSNPADTALALNFLSQAGHNADADTAQAVTYLKSVQNIDGGWAVLTGGRSIVQPTSHAMSALAGYRDTYSVDAELVNAVIWLTSKQNVDGGFGNSPSTIYDTAVAVEALIASGAPRADIDDGLSYLLSRQSTSGSWNYSVFQTSLAVDAIQSGQIEVDLGIESADIVFTPNPVNELTPVDVNVAATVHNYGVANVTGVTVSLYEDDPALGNLVQEQLVDVNGSSTTIANFTANVTQTGVVPYYVQVDTLDVVSEASELNNLASNNLLVNIPPPTVGFTLASDSAVEVSSVINLEVSLSHLWDQDITLDYTVNGAGTATVGTDFTLTNGSVTFLAGETSKQVPVTLNEDAILEDDETIIVDLANVSPVEVTLAQAQMTFTILDNETPSVGIISPAGLVTTSTPQLLFSQSSGTAVVKVDGLVVAKANGDNLDALVDGDHTLRVEVTNAANVTGFDELTFTIDTTAPVVTITEPLAGYVLESDPVLSYSVTGTDIVSVVVTVDGNTVSTVSGERLSPLTDGPHTIRVEAEDNAGLTAFDEVLIDVDSTSPVVTISAPAGGTIDVSGSQGNYIIAGEGGPGGFDGGTGGGSKKSGYRAEGPGGGYGGAPDTTAYIAGGCGGGGGYALSGEGGGAYNGNQSTSGAGGGIYGNERILPLIGGSGGGGGGGSAGYVGGGGGGGGGAILIASSGTINLPSGAAIRAKGARGTDGQKYGSGWEQHAGGGGGGGSGGAIRLIANIIKGDGELNATGGEGGYGYYKFQRNGNIGRITLEATALERTVGTSPPFVRGTPYSVVPEGMPTLVISSIAGSPVPTSPAGSYSAPDIVLPYGTSNLVPVEVQGKNIPVGFQVTIKAHPAVGSPAVSSGILSGSESLSSTIIDAQISSAYPTVITAFVTYPLTAFNMEPFYYQGELVNSIKVASSLGEGSSLFYVTESGKEIPAVM